MNDFVLLMEGIFFEKDVKKGAVAQVSFAQSHKNLTEKSRPIQKEKPALLLNYRIMQKIQQLQYIRIVNGCQQFRFTFCSGEGKIIEKSEFYRQISAQLEELDYTELYTSPASACFRTARIMRRFPCCWTPCMHFTARVTRK